MDSSPKAITFSMTGPYRHDSRISAYLLMPPTGVIGEKILHLRGSQGEFLIRRVVISAGGVVKISCVGTLLILQGDTDILIVDSEDTGKAMARIPKIIQHFVHPINGSIGLVGISENKYTIETHLIEVDNFGYKIITTKLGNFTFGSRLNGIFGCRGMELETNSHKLTCGFATVGVSIKTFIVGFESQRDQKKAVYSAGCELDLPLPGQVLNLEVAAGHVMALVQERNPEKTSILSVMIWSNVTRCGERSSSRLQVYSTIQIPKPVIHPESKKLLAVWVSDNGASRVETKKVRNSEPSSASLAVSTGLADRPLEIYTTTGLNLKLICEGVKQKNRVGGTFAFPSNISFVGHQIKLTTPGGIQLVDITRFVEFKPDEGSEKGFWEKHKLWIIATGAVLMCATLAWFLRRANKKSSRKRRFSDSDPTMTLTTSQLD